MDFDRRPVRRVAEDEGRAMDRATWPATVPAVTQLLDEGLDLAPGVTFLVGENGSGKSTIVEAVAVAFGLSPEGGTPYGLHSTRVTESDLAASLRLERGAGSSRYGFFLRAETMHGWYTFSEEHQGPDYHAMSHGESFLEVLRTRFDSDGLYCLDEPEAALSFSATLGLISVLASVTAGGGQVLCATHSPVLAAMPGARILEVGDWGLRESTWEDLALVSHWRRYLDEPQRYLRHVLED